MKRTPQWRTFNLIYLACIYSILVLGIHLAVAFLVADQQQRTILMDEISPIIDVLTCVTLFIAAKQSITRSKRLAWAWATIGLAMFCYALGDFVWAILEVGLKLQPFPSIADGFYLAFYPVYLIGVLLLPEKQVSSNERIKKAIDIGIVMVAAILGYWNFLIGPSILSNLNQPRLSQLILLAYPVGDLVLFAALLLIINNRASGHDDVPLLLLAGSIISMIITDSIYSYQSHLGIYASGGLLDIGWILSTLLLGLAGISLITSSESKSSPEKFLQDHKIITNFKVIAPFVPYLWILGAYLLLVVSGLRPLPMSSVSLSLVVGGMILLVLVRQIITSVSERSNLTNQLKNTNQELLIELTERKLADETLQESEKRFRALVEHSLEEISMVDSDGTLTYESQTSRRPLGYPPNSLVGHNIFEILHPDERAAAAQILEQTIKNPGSVQEALFRLRHQNGSWRWMEGILTNLLDEPAVQSVVINYRDITERKRAEDEVQALLEMMLGAATTESLPELLELIRQSLAKVIFAENFFVVFHNSITGLFEEVFAMDKYDPPLSPSRLEKSITAYVFRTGQPLLLTQTEFEELKARGEVELVGTSPASWLGAPLRTPSETIGIMAVQNYEDPNCYSERDKEFIASVGAQVALVIERKRAEQEIVSLAKFPSENPNPVLRFSPEGVLMYANAASSLLLAMWGCEVGGSAPQFLCDLVSQVLASMENKTIEIDCDGKVYSIIVTPMAEPAYVNLYGRNITARKKAEEEIRTSNDELSMLFELSHSLAEADKLDDILDHVNRHAVESIHTTFARIALLEDEKFIFRAAYPVRVLDQDLGIGHQHPVTSLPYTQYVMEQNEPMILRAGDPGISNEEKKVLLLGFAQSLCLIPLRSSDSSPTAENLLGFLMLGEARNEEREPFTPEKIRLARSIGDLAAIAIRRMLLSEQTGRRLQQSIALSEIDQAIISTSDMVISLDTLLLHTAEQLKVDAADVWFYNPTSQALEFVTGRGFRSHAFENPKPIQLGEGNAGRAALERRTIHVPNLTVHADNPRLAQALVVEPFISYYAVPLIVKEQIKGVLELFHRTELEPGEEWLRFLNALANQAAIAIDNSSLFNDLQHSNTELTQAYDATIQGWSRALDLRDKETEGHTQRVTELTVKLGRQFGLTEKDLVHVRRGALLHDIGKMGVPDGILLKPGPLTAEEWIIMRKHPVFAYEMLSPIHYLVPALDIPYGHHEKWDGTGYPRGLSGDQIPFAARLFALVDVWDALTSDRPYRAAWPEQKVLDHIRSLVGTHFDPQVVKVCLESGLLKGSKKIE